MTSINKLEELNEFEQEKICHLLECNFDDPEYKEKYTNFYNSFLK